VRRKAHGRDGSQQSALPGLAGRWEPAPFTREELAAALVAGGVAGAVTSHDRRNARGKFQRLVEGDPGVLFGLTGLSGGATNGLSFEEILGVMAAAAGFDPSPDLLDGPMSVDPDLVLDACEAVGTRLRHAADEGASVLLATGHPGGLLLLYQASAMLLERSGAKLLEPRDGYTWEQERHRRQIRYFGGVAAYTSRADMLHTHSPEPMELLLQDATPDLVFADHGFAGAAIEAGIETISIIDVNDPAPAVARAQGRTTHVICMDDNVRPESYWPCFQAIAGAFGANGADGAFGGPGSPRT
jgi:hypothetical protein